MITLFHGSPTPNIKILEPRFDQRLKFTALFMSDMIFAPMAFALLPDRSQSDVMYGTYDRRFLHGHIITKAINDIGYVYTIMVPEEQVLIHPIGGCFYTIEPQKPIECNRVDRNMLADIGWKLSLEKQQLKISEVASVMCEA